MSIRLKHAVLGTFLEPAARCYVHRIRPLIETAKHPERALLYQETHFLLKAVGRLIEPGSNCIDVGSHIGLMLREFTRLAPQGRHIGVEPTPQKAAWLKRKFPRADIFQCALADRSGTAPFHENLRDSAFNALGSVRIANGHDRIREYDVEVKTLDDIADRSRRFRLVKIDAEGAELLVLRGGEKLIERDRPAIIFECGAPEEGSRAGDELFSYFAGKDYEVYTALAFLCRNKPLSRDVFNHARSFPPTAFNFIALPRT